AALAERCSNLACLQDELQRLLPSSASERSRNAKTSLIMAPRQSTSVWKFLAQVVFPVQVLASGCFLFAKITVHSIVAGEQVRSSTARMPLRSACSRSARLIDRENTTNFGLVIKPLVIAL